jgi:hypothetical protein
MQSLLFLTEKRDGRVKGRLVYNGKPTREWVSKDDAASPTASLEGILLTSILDVKENRDVMSADIPNAFIQANLPDMQDGDERVVMKITGVLVDLLVEIDVAKYGPYVVFENWRKNDLRRITKSIIWDVGCGTNLVSAVQKGPRNGRF